MKSKTSSPAAKTPRRALAPDPRSSAQPSGDTKNANDHAPAAANIAGGVNPEGGLNRRPSTADKRKAAAEEKVTVTVPRPFKFTQDDHSMVDYPVGIYEMPRAHAEDSFAVAHGVTINE